MSSSDSTLNASQLVLRNGYAGTSVRNLALALGCTTSELYASCGDKAQCMAELIRWEEKRMVELQQDVEAGNRDCRVQLRSWLSRLQSVQAQGEYPVGLLCINLPLQLGPNQDALRREIAGVHDRAIKWIGSRLERVDRRSTEPGAREIAEYIFAAFAGCVLLGVTDHDHWEVDNGLARLYEYIDAL